MKKSLNKTNGITLIALVVTVAILIILSLITINIAINGGVLNKTQKAKEVYEKGQQNDINGIKDFENELDEILNDNTQEEGNGNLEIVSTFANYDDLLAVGNMLVNVNCTKDGQTVHKELINLEQTEASQSVIIENLPSGTTANVTVEYTQYHQLP